MKKLKEKWRVWLERYSPPGFPAGTEWGIYGAGMGLAVLFSFGFFARYEYALKLVKNEDALYTSCQNGMELLFWKDVLGSAMLGFYFVSALAVAYIIRRYLFYFQESKSIYTMRRLGRPFELHKRALVHPATMLLMSFLTAFVLWLVYFQIYKSCPPEQYVTPEQWLHLWY